MSERGRTQSLAVLFAAALALAGCAETTFAVHTAKNLGVGQSSRDGSGIYKVGEPYEIGGVWYTLDARHNAPRIGRVLMARGRDAVDAALTTSFGPANLTGFTVWTDELPTSA